MATRTGRLFQDQNLNAHVNGAGSLTGKAGFTGQKKALAGQRKPLGDLSNAGKPINLAGGKKNLDEKLKSKNLTVIANDEGVNAKAKKASVKSHAGSRKALGDISNLVPKIKNSDDHKRISFELSAISKLKSESAYLELEMVPEQELELQALSAQHDSPAYCKTPKPPSYCTMWNNSDVNFKLMETP
ncbi:hypothetical protein RIF29_22976 [Crotalaria pallida]|uniref:Uncharacterized protein n=1 Tax=Crotalaria pallida TaxID=3830 RepID=A0AAN9F778_CROPI